MPIKDTSKQLTQLLKKRKKNHKELIGERYPNKDGYSEDYSFFLEDTEEILNDELTPYFAANIFRDMSSWYLANMQYQIIEYSDFTKAIEYLKKCGMYSYLTLYVYVLESHCHRIGGSQLWCDTVFEKISNTVICGYEKEYIQMNEWIIESIDYGRSSTKGGGVDSLFYATGSKLCVTSWFLLDLYCKVYGRAYNIKNAEYPDDISPYNTVLDKWDTTDLDELDKLVYLLSEHHIIQTEEAKKEEDYFLFDRVSYWLYPYEILAWLKLRELKGLKNPTEFTHPLMNTPIAKMFLDIKEPLPKPKELPYAKELLEKLKEKCPDVEIPEWLGVEKEKETASTPTIHLKSNQLAPKTGRYQATLNKEHPQAELSQAGEESYTYSKAGNQI